MSLFTLKPTHTPVKAYYAALAQFEKHGRTIRSITARHFSCDEFLTCFSTQE